MRYSVDHDYHIHSKISLCSNDPEQTPERILKYAEENALKKICLTDHHWDEAVDGASQWYRAQNFAHISQALPLPQGEGIDFLFGCETDFDRLFTVGISKEHFDRFDFVIIPTTHLHMTGFTIDPCDTSVERRAELWVKRLDKLLNMELPFHKIGIAHLACALIAPTREEYLRVLNLIPDAEMTRLFKKAAELGVGIELNSDDMLFSEAEADTVLRIFRTAKREGCKFYLGSDAHHPDTLNKAKQIFERAIDYLALEESDKFHIS